MNKKFSKGSVPMYLFTLLFVILPLGFLLLLSFMQKDGALSYKANFSFKNYQLLMDGAYLHTFLKSLRLSFITTIITVLIGYPFAYFMSRCESEKIKTVLLILVILPFWTNALVRIYGFVILFRGNGIIHQMLNFLGMGENFGVLYTPKAVVMGMVYALLPFMIMTAYSACSKLDTSILEAARDLGATPRKAFFDVALPITHQGLISGISLVFIPSLGLFFISDILGGGKVMIAGNLIKDQIMISHNYPFAAAISVVMLLLMLIATEITKILIRTIIKKDFGK